jgi:hypothetical protein
MTTLIPKYELTSTTVNRPINKKLQDVIDIMDFIPATEQDAILDRTSTYDCTANIQSAIDYASSIKGANINFPAGKFNISATVNLKSYCNIYGVSGETPNSGVTGNAGTLFNWIGSSSATTNMFSGIDMRETTFDSFAIEGNGATGLTAILYDSTDGSSAECNFTRFAIRECYIGVQWGTTGVNVAHGAQAQFITFTIWSVVTGAKGFVINSGNVGQQCIMAHGGIQVPTVCIDLITANLLQIYRVFGGGNVATAFIRAQLPLDVTVQGCSSENRAGTDKNVTTAPFLHVIPSVEEPTFPTRNFCLNLIGNQMNNPCVVDAPIRINSIGNHWGFCWDGGAFITATGTFNFGAAISRCAVMNDGLTTYINPAVAAGWQRNSYVNMINLDPEKTTFTQNLNGYFAMETFTETRGWSNVQAADGYAAYFTVAGNNVGRINTSTTATSYVTTSDYRLKENVLPMTGALDIVSKLKPVTYKWKTTGENGQGFIAHQLQEFMPSCVTGEKDAVDKNGNPVYQGIDTSFLVATLTLAIQELKAEIDILKAK